LGPEKRNSGRCGWLKTLYEISTDYKYERKNLVMGSEKDDRI